MPKNLKTMEVDDFDFANGLGFGVLMEFWYKCKCRQNIANEEGIQDR